MEGKREMDSSPHSFNTPRHAVLGEGSEAAVNNRIVDDNSGDEKGGEERRGEERLLKSHCRDGGC